MISFWGFALYIAVLGGAIVDAFICGWRSPRGAPRRYLMALGMFSVHVTLLLGVRVFALEAYRNPSTSMRPTIELGDEVLVNKLASTGVGDLERRVVLACSNVSSTRRTMTFGSARTTWTMRRRPMMLTRRQTASTAKPTLDIPKRAPRSTSRADRHRGSSCGGSSSRAVVRLAA